MSTTPTQNKWLAYWGESASHSGLPSGSVARADVFRAIDRLSRTTYRTLPAQLDRSRSYRNRFIRAVRL